MADREPRRIMRRELLVGATALAAFGSASRLSASVTATPRQSAGPFYPVDWDGDIDWDLVRVAGEDARALGQVTHLQGRVTDLGGAPIAGARVEIWQCDANGRYRHPGDDRSATRDPAFQGRGRVVTDGQGRYRFRTIRPVPYPGRTPHIHFRVIAEDGRELITQMYVAGEPQNKRDFLFTRLRDPSRVLVSLNPADSIEQGALVGTFDIVMG